MSNPPPPKTVLAIEDDRPVFLAVQMFRDRRLSPEDLHPGRPVEVVLAGDQSEE